MQNRFRSPVLWLAIFSLIGFISKQIFHWEFLYYDELVELIMAVLIALGVVNNPTDKEHI